MSIRKAGPVASRTGLFERTSKNTAIQEVTQQDSKPRIKRTFNIPDDVVLLLNEIQIQRYRTTGKKPESLGTCNRRNQTSGRSGSARNGIVTMAPAADEHNEWVYIGFGVPTFTQIPDDFIDEVAPRLKEGELRVMLYVMRRTYGFGKVADRISINQLCSGITTRDGRRLDWGTGMSRSAVRRGVDGCIKKGLLTVTREQSESGEYETNIYTLRFRPGVVLEETHPQPEVVPFEAHPLPFGELPGGSPEGPPVGLFKTLQETEQQTASRNRIFEDSNEDQLVIRMDDRIWIGRYMEDLARELRDQAPLPASTTRACRLFVRSGMDRDEFTTAMLEARRRTQEHSSTIKARAAEGRVGEKAKLAYWFAVLEDVVGLREQPTGD